MQITVGFWVIPLVITIGGYIWAHVSTKDDYKGGYNLQIGEAFALLLWLAGSLFVWLVWAVAVLVIR